MVEHDAQQFDTDPESGKSKTPDGGSELDENCPQWEKFSRPAKRYARRVMCVVGKKEHIGKIRHLLFQRG